MVDSAERVKEMQSASKGILYRDNRLILSEDAIKVIVVVVLEQENRSIIRLERGCAHIANLSLPSAIWWYVATPTPSPRPFAFNTSNGRIAFCLILLWTSVS